MTINLESLADGSVADRNFQKLGSLVLDTGGRSLRLLGPFTATSGALAAGAAVGPFTATHAFGSTDYIVLGEPMDAGFGYSVNWLASKGPTATAIYFRNNGGIAGAALTVNYYLLG